MEREKTIGMITLHSLHNCGSMLQTYALHHFLDSIDGVKSEIINFIPQSLDNKRAFRIDGELAQKYADKVKSRNYKFTKFAQDHYHLSATIYHSDEEIEANPPMYDIYVSGSDQIWNANFRIASRAYFLGFTSSNCKYAFAPSVGRCMEKKLVKYYKQLIAYKKIWVRERTGVERIKNVTGRYDIDWMPDPTFLYSRENYDELIKEYPRRERDYILCYATLDDQLDQMMPILKALSKRLALPVLLIGGIIPREESWIINCVDIGPIDFLQAIRDAKFILTQTFHGTIFSLLYNKPFLTYNDAMPNFRKTGLLTELNLLNRIIHTKEELDSKLSSELDYEYVNKKINAFQTTARTNIRNCIKEAL